MNYFVNEVDMEACGRRAKYNRIASVRTLRGVDYKNLFELVVVSLNERMIYDDSRTPNVSFLIGSKGSWASSRATGWAVILLR